jgi:riboflavin synthase
MFTGIVEESGEVLESGDHRLVVGCSTVLEDAAGGGSIAVNGVCLTVTEREAGSLSFDLSDETLERTTLGRLEPGEKVNLERPVTLATRLGGHLVQGHVDAVGSVTSVEPDGGGATILIEAPEGVARYLVEKGSVAVDGVSLTVASVNGTAFGVALIPHTLEVTTLGLAKPGDHVNLEADVIAKYVARLAGR